MLISTRLDVLGDLLHTNKVIPLGYPLCRDNSETISIQEAMQTKGVPSVRSPVRNLQSYSSTVTHEAFVNAVISSFRAEYSIDEEVLFSFTTSPNMPRVPRWMFLAEYS